jgi:hypothetical protein
MPHSTLIHADVPLVNALEFRQQPQKGAYAKEADCCFSLACAPTFGFDTEQVSPGICLGCGLGAATSSSLSLTERREDGKDGKRNKTDLGNIE